MNEKQCKIKSQEIREIVKFAYLIKPEVKAAVKILKMGYDETDIANAGIEDTKRIPVQDAMRIIKSMKCVNKKCPDYVKDEIGNCSWRTGEYYNCIYFKGDANGNG